MLLDYDLVEKLTEKYGSPLYVFHEKEFVDNYKDLENAFKKVYENYQISYSYKTNYTPYIASVVKRLGGYAEVVSGMEYYIAKKLGYKDENIIFNGPNKGEDGIKAFLNGSIINIDNLTEIQRICETASSHPDLTFEVGIRVNIDVGQDFISRFGIDITEIPIAVKMIGQVSNLKVAGLHCHISRCRGLDAWRKRVEKMLQLSDQYFEQPPRYIDLGSGMFGSMAPEFASQFSNVPTYEEYATCVAKLFAEHYQRYSKNEKPILFTEPGTTLINRFVDFIGRVDTIKTVRGKTVAVLNCSEHNLGETCLLKELPMRIVSNGEQQDYEEVDFTGYTCLEQDVMRRNYTGNLAVGDYVVFGNVGGYSNVLKPPFIWPNCAMIAITLDGDVKLMKQKETYEDILHTYMF